MANIKTKPRAEKIDIEIGKTIKKLRKLRGFSQEKIANDLGVSFQQIQKYERGVNRVSASRMYILAKILQVDINDFFIGIDDDSNVLQIDDETIKLVSKFRRIEDPKIRNLIFVLLNEANKS